jgi:DNA helicase-2/ATP-dependent DNA helicase PcrA
VKKNEIKVGGLYKAKVNGKVVTVRVDSIRERDGFKRVETVYGVTNLSTGRTTTFRSAAKFREETPNPKANVSVRYPTPKDTTVVPQSAIKRELVEAVESEGEQGPDPTPVASAVAPSGIRPVVAQSSPSKPVVSSGLASKLHPADTSPHVEVQALAGTGKTTTVVEGLVAAKGKTPRVRPSPQQEEVWRQLAGGRSTTVRLSAFNTTITDELKKRVTETGLDRVGIEARGVHSLGLQAVTKAVGRKEASKWAVIDHVCACLGRDFQDLKREPGMMVLVNAVDDLVSLCKQTLTDPTPDGLDRLSSRYDVEVTDRARVYDLVPAVLDRCKTPKGKIHFDDMVWLPLVLDLPIEKVDLQVIDESQDLNRMQQELIYRAGRRIVFVGDRHQAIYGFAGADAESMQRMKETLGRPCTRCFGGPCDPNCPEKRRGCITLPLTVTRRCGKAIVREAQRFVPEFEAHVDNPEGVVRKMKFSRKGGGYGSEETGVRPWEETYGPHAEDGCLVLCRVNAPLVSECMRFLKRRIKANILGRKVGAGLTTLIEKSKATTVPQLVGWLADWLSREEAVENAKKFPSETRLEQLQDKHDCILAFTEDCTYAADVVRKIDSVFTDSKEKVGVRFSSIHKSKGLEARQVFVLRPPGSGPREDKMQAWELEQEDNLRYVAVTRAVEELVYVS